MVVHLERAGERCLRGGKKGEKKARRRSGVKWSCEGGHRLRRRWLPCRELLLRLRLLLYLSLASGALVMRLLSRKLGDPLRRGMEGLRAYDLERDDADLEHDLELRE